MSNFRILFQISMSFQSKAKTIGSSISALDDENHQSHDQMLGKKSSFFFIPKRPKKANSINDDFFERVQRIRTQGGAALNKFKFDSNDFSCFDDHWSDIPNTIDSKLIDDDKQLKKTLNLSDNNFRLRLLYRASQHDFSVQKFHELCDRYSNTITFCSIQNGNIVGGFTPLKWQDQFQVNETHFKSDPFYTSFIFNYSMGQKYSLVKIPNNNAIVGCNYLGPTFGGGFDLSIGNNANLNCSSICQFPVSYEQPSFGSNRINGNRKTITGIQDDCFFIDQWEVFQLVYSPISEVTEQTSNAKINEGKQQDNSLIKNFSKRVKDCLSLFRK